MRFARVHLVLAIVLSSGCKPEAKCEGGTKLVDGSCAASTCGAPFSLLTNGGCDAPNKPVLIAARRLTLGPSDWEAEGRVATRTVDVSAFLIDAHEVTEARFFAWREPSRAVAPTRFPMTNVTFAQAAQFCTSKAGRLPTEDEWMAAAMGDAQRRYPWGDTGAVCNRAAWGKAGGQCGHATQPDAVGAHARGSTQDHIDDLAGNVSEWVTITSGQFDVAKGGSWRSSLATELRNWSRTEHPSGHRGDDVGFRCAYDPITTVK